MLNTTNKLLLSIIVLLLCACVHINEAKVDMKELKSDSNKFGVSVFRVMYTGDAKAANQMTHGENLPDHNLRVVYLYAKKINPSTSNEKRDLFQISVNNNDELKDKEKFFITKNKNEEIIKINPSYFYAIKMLPEGNYYIESIKIHGGRGTLL